MTRSYSLCLRRDNRVRVIECSNYSNCSDCGASNYGADDDCDDVGGGDDGDGLPAFLTNDPFNGVNRGWSWPLSSLNACFHSPDMCVICFVICYVIISVWFVMMNMYVHCTYMVCMQLPIPLSRLYFVIL